MDCKKAERFLLRSYDTALEPEEKKRLQGHLEGCPSCRRKDREYREILGHLRPDFIPEPLPYFRERLLARIREKDKAAPALFGLKWAHRAVLFFLAVQILFGVGLLLTPREKTRELSRAERLFLQNENPLTETASLLNQQRAEDKNMMLIFASLDDRNGGRR
ncbi:MAG: zf-HC2 domain-containing protein [Candidatus Aminicenantes bacterium]|nr:zf-HC2 domain-containing protein [Candidatus Aminicenantes bacterium]